ncbi:MAG: NAD(P)-dependent oxidoreductase [Actinomycetota bacterium]|nr:NAD(P)-dependent oxidoreductase [Actinomycetota bacterium]
MRLLVTGATGFLGWRVATLLADRGHEITALARPGGAQRSHSRGLDAVELDAGDPAVRELIAGRDAVLHFAGVPDPASARADPARAVRENAGTTLNLLEGCAEHAARLVYPSTVRLASERPPDAYAVSKLLGEEVCRLHRARATVVRLTSVFGPGQVAAEGATGAIAAFAARALAGEPLVIPGNPERTRDFAYVDDVVEAIERLAGDANVWNETVTVAAGTATPLRRAAELVRAAAGSDVPIETPGGTLPEGEDESYAAPSDSALAFHVRPLEEGIGLYVDWLRRHSAA